MKRRRGFTLVEMVIVMLIIAILSGAAIIQFRSYIEKANDMAAKERVRHIRDVFMLWKLQNPDKDFPGGSAPISWTGATPNHMDELLAFARENLKESDYRYDGKYRYVYFGPYWHNGKWNPACIRVDKFYGNSSNWIGWNTGELENGVMYSLTLDKEPFHVNP